LLEPGQRLGPYELIKRLGAGGMGEVYRARDTRLQRDVAIKVLPPHLSSNDTLRRRFQQEARAIAALSHPNILAIYDVGREGKIDYLVTELLEGETLHDALHGAAMPVTQAVDIGVAIASGLAAAHEKGIIHRDVKPENVFLVGGDTVKLLDFGLARLVPDDASQEATRTLDTKPGTVMGTVRYMSPEQLRGRPLDARTDIFSLGCVLYELLSGRRPFEGDSAADVTTAILTQDPPELSGLVDGVSTELDRTIRRCLEKNAGRRFQSVSDLAFTLRQLFSDLRQPATAVSDQALSPEEGPSIAVLPFANLSNDAENEYFSDGITEEIINTLARVGGLRVAARTSAFAFKGQTVDLSEVADKLNVSAILEGSVRKVGSRIRITVQLINADDGYHLWSERFDRNLDDVFAVQDEIAAAITDKLRLSLEMSGGARLGRPPTRNMEAYDAYLKARRQMSLGYGMDLMAALGLFERAVELDPEFAPAHAGIAESYSSLGFMATLPPREAMPKAKAAAQRALELDETLADAHCALATVAMVYDREWELAERGFRRSLDLNPNSIQTMYHFGHVYHGYVSHNINEGIALCRRAAELDPLAAYPLHGWIANLLMAGRSAEALPILEEAIRADEQAFHLRRIKSLCCIELGMMDEAQSSLAEALRLSGRHPWALMEWGALQVMTGDRAGGEAAYFELLARSRTSYVQRLSLCVIPAWLGRMDEAFEHLEQGCLERDAILIALTAWPPCRPFWSDARCDALLDRLGLRRSPHIS